MRAHQQLDGLARHRVGEFRRLRRRHPARQVEDRLFGKVKLRRHAQAVGVVDAKAALHVVERPFDGERGRGHHGGPHAIEQHLANERRHVDRRRAQEHAAVTGLEEIHEAGIGRFEQESQLVAQFRRASRQRGGILVDLGAAFFRPGPAGHRRRERVERRDQRQALIDDVAKPVRPDAQAFFERRLRGVTRHRERPEKRVRMIVEVRDLVAQLRAVVFDRRRGSTPARHRAPGRRCGSC